MEIAVLAKDLDGAPPEFRLLPYGEIEAEGIGKLVVDEEAMRSIVSHFNRRGLDMVIDYEHQSMKDSEAPAAGWIKRLINKGKDGLWAVVEWTEKAKAYLKNREYRYFSPVLWFSSRDRRVTRIQNVALTNNPRLNGLEPIVAKLSREEARAAQRERSRRYGIGIKEGGHVTKPSEWASVPDDEWLDPVNYRYPCPDAAQTRAAASYWGKPKNQAQYTAEERAIIEKRLRRFKKKYKVGEYRKEEARMERLKKILRLNDDATEEQAIEAVERLVAKVDTMEKDQPVACKEVLEALEIEGDADKSMVIARIDALKAPADVAQKLSTEVAELKSTLRKMKQEQLLEQALKEGKTTPDELDEWGREMALKDPEAFKKIVLARERGSMIPVDDLKPKQGDKGGELDEIQLSINKMLGIDEETWKKYGPHAEE